MSFLLSDGLPPSSSCESLSVRSCPPPRPPLPEQKDYGYPASWGSEISPNHHRASNITVNSGIYIYIVLRFRLLYR